MPQISVIVPVYKVELFLNECVDSVLDQTFTDFELILVDDGSPDNCPQICDEYAKKDNRVFVIHKVNGGLSSARNAGLDYVFSNSNSKYISFIDSDDFVDKNFLKTLIEKIDNCDLCICSFATFLNDDLSHSIIEDPNSVDGIFNKLNIWDESINGALRSIACNKLYKRHIFKNIRYPEGKIHEDDFVIHHLLNECNFIRVIPDSLYHYRLRSESIMNSLDKNTHDFMVLEIMTDRAMLFLNNDNFGFFSKAFSKLSKLYFVDKKRCKPTFIVLKKMHKIRKLQNTSIPKSERLFFASPTLYYFLLNVRKLTKRP